MSIEPSEVCILLPTLDEAKTVGAVIDGFRNQGFENVLVVDGNSVDGTRDVAVEHGAKVLNQSGSGKGQAIREAVESIEQEYVLMADADSTYYPEDAQVMLEPLENGYEHVIGNRFAHMEDEAMKFTNRVGNRIINAAFKLVHREAYADILSGYRAFTTESFERSILTADGFCIETELAVECARHSIKTTVVPIQYGGRHNDAESNLHPVWDGIEIMGTVYGLARYSNPMFFFGVVGVLCWVLGTIAAGYVGIEWVTQRMGHESIAVVAAFFYLFGAQTLMFGFLSDMILRFHTEQLESRRRQ